MKTKNVSVCHEFLTLHPKKWLFQIVVVHLISQFKNSLTKNWLHSTKKNLIKIFIFSLIISFIKKWKFCDWHTEREQEEEKILIELSNCFLYFYLVCTNESFHQLLANFTARRSEQHNWVTFAKKNCDFVIMTISKLAIVYALFTLMSLIFVTLEDLFRRID